MCKTWRFFSPWVILLALLNLLNGCQTSTKTSQLPLVVTSTSMIRDGLTPLIGGYADIHVLMGPGSDPHSYRPVPSDLSHLEAATLIVFNGFHLEGNMSSILENKQLANRAFRLSDFLGPNAAQAADAYTWDPHFWFDPILWFQVISKTAEYMGPTLGIPPDTLNHRIASFKTHCIDLDQKIWCRLEPIPPRQRVLLTVHDAFTYFGKRYSIEVKSLQGVSTTAEFGVYEVESMVDYILAHKIPAVFTETGQSKRSMEAVVKGCATKGHLLIQGATLYADAPGPAGSPAPDWTSMLLSNALAIGNALNPPKNHGEQTAR